MKYQLRSLVLKKAVPMTCSQLSRFSSGGGAGAATATAGAAGTAATAVVLGSVVPLSGVLGAASSSSVRVGGSRFWVGLSSRVTKRADASWFSFMVLAAACALVDMPSFPSNTTTRSAILPIPRATRPRQFSYPDLSGTTVLPFDSARGGRSVFARARLGRWRLLEMSPSPDTRQHEYTTADVGVAPRRSVVWGRILCSGRESWRLLGARHL